MSDRAIKQFPEVDTRAEGIASSADAALDVLETEVPHVIVTDLGMPHTDGFQLLWRIRSHRNSVVRHIPTAALTAYARSDDRAKALRAGFHMHLAKPIDPTELVAAVGALAKRAPSRQRRLLEFG